VQKYSAIIANIVLHVGKYGDVIADTIVLLLSHLLHTLLYVLLQKQPENTNRFLQLLALAATEVPDSTAAVKQVLGSDSAFAEVSVNNALYLPLCCTNV
jgi:hypothetical protein